MPFVGYQYGVYSGVENGANRFDHTFSSGDSDSNYYVSATYWMPKIEYVRITADTALGQYAFYRNSTIETLILPNTLNSIGLDLLRGTTNLQNLTIPFVGNTRGITNKVEATFGYFYYNSESSIETIMQYYVAPNTLPVNGEGVLLSDLKASSSLDESDIDFSYASDVLASSSNANKAVTTTDSDGNKHYVPVGTYHSEVTVGYGYIPSRNLKIVSITDETVIGTGAFMNFSHIEQIKLNDKITLIDKYAFFNCTSLGCVDIGDSVNNHDHEIGQMCNEFNVPTSIVEISDYAFYNCSSFTSINLPSHIMTLGNFSFASCNGITTLTIPETLKTVGSHSFANCKMLTGSIDFKGQAFGEYMFAGCDGIESLTIQDSITEIPNGAFYNCNKLADVTFQGSFRKIGSYAFYSCSALKNIEFKSTESIGDYAFYKCTTL